MSQCDWKKGVAKNMYWKIQNGINASIFLSLQNKSYDYVSNTIILQVISCLRFFSFFKSSEPKHKWQVMHEYAELLLILALGLKWKLRHWIWGFSCTILTANTGSHWIIARAMCQRSLLKITLYKRSASLHKNRKQYKEFKKFKLHGNLPFPTQLSSSSNDLSLTSSWTT